MQKDSNNAGSLNSSSLIDLKAELFRKQEDFKNQKLNSHNAGYIKGKSSGAANKKPNIFSRKNAGVAKRAEKDYEEKKEEENVFDRSRRALENKARLYEKITSGKEIPEEDGGDLYLVDFQKKVIDKKVENREKERQEKEERENREAEEDRRMLQMPVPEAENEEEEWVDYVDSFGRSRKCLRKDLEKLKSADRKTGLQQRDKDVDTPNLLSDDMRRELERQKWEKEETERMEKEKDGPIHYADVRHSEVRTHGVGYYQFDKAEETRQEQMEQLKKLREETIDERSKKERIKEKRKAALAARLAKVKQRKREKMGITEEEGEEKADSEEEVGPKLSEMKEIAKEPEPLTRDDKWRQTAQLTREWDKGKERSMERSEQAWLEKQRAERETEFAPPSFYYEDRKPNTQTFSDTNTSKKDGEAEFAPPSFYHEDRKPNKRTLNDIQNKDSNKSFTQPKHVKTEHIGTSEECGNVNKSSEILANVIMNKLRGYKNQDDTTNTPQDITEWNEHSNVVSNIHSGQYNTTGIANTTGSTQDTSVPPPNIIAPPPNFQTPPPSFQAPPPAFQNHPPNFQNPPPHIHAMYSNTSMPPPNLSFPPPTANVQPSNINIPPPNFTAPPPNMNVPYSYFSQPPPPLPKQTYPITTEHVPNTEYSHHGQSSAPYVGQTNQAAQNQATDISRTVQSKPKKVIPKMDIMDRRLIQNDDN